MKKRTKKTYSPMDETQSTVSTIKMSSSGKHKQSNTEDGQRRNLKKKAMKKRTDSSR